MCALFPTLLLRDHASKQSANLYDLYLLLRV